jgi:hypothetical protein
MISRFTSKAGPASPVDLPAVADAAEALSWSISVRSGCAKIDRLEIGIGAPLHPGIQTGFILEC